MRNIFYCSFIILFILSSCVSKKDIVYLQFDEFDKEKTSNNYQLYFKPDDLLQITVSASDLESVQPFNLPVIAYSSITNNFFGQPQLQSYLVDKNGNITFPVLGTLKVAGLTRQEAIEMITNKLHPELVKNPIVNIIITNFKISVQGNVSRPGTFNIPNERISIFDAIGLAGDLEISGKRKNILVIREEGDKKEQYRLDLTSNKVFSSPAYYLQQNDIVYVEPNKANIQDATYTRSTGLFISLASVIISLITVLTR